MFGNLVEETYRTTGSFDVRVDAEPQRPPLLQWAGQTDQRIQEGWKQVSPLAEDIIHLDGWPVDGFDGSDYNQFKGHRTT